MSKAVFQRWFSTESKIAHRASMENLMTCGLPFLQEVMESTGSRKAVLVFHSSCTKHYGMFKVMRMQNDGDVNHIPGYDDAKDGGEEQEFTKDSLDECNRCWLWANRGTLFKTYHAWSRNGHT